MLFAKFLGILLTVSLISGFSPIQENVNADGAIQIFEQHCKCKVQFPNHIPFKPTKISGNYDKPTEKLRLTYHNEYTNQTLNFDVVVKKSDFRRNSGQKFNLLDGTNADYYYNVKRGVAEIIVFEKNGLEYGIGMLKNSGKIIGLEKLKLVADSIK